MKAIDKVVLEKVNRQYTIGFNCVSNCTEFEKFVYFTNGGKCNVGALLSEIGNKGFDSWIIVEKMKRSRSVKNVEKYLSKFIELLETCK